MLSTLTLQSANKLWVVCAKPVQSPWVSFGQVARLTHKPLKALQTMWLKVVVCARVVPLLYSSFEHVFCNFSPLLSAPLSTSSTGPIKTTTTYINK